MRITLDFDTCFIHITTGAFGHAVIVNKLTGDCCKLSLDHLERLVIKLRKKRA